MSISAPNHTEIIFIDGRIDLAQLTGLPSDATIFVLDLARDGIAQMANFLDPHHAKRHAQQ